MLVLLVFVARQVHLVHYPSIDIGRVCLSDRFGCLLSSTDDLIGRFIELHHGMNLRWYSVVSVGERVYAVSQQIALVIIGA